MEPTAAPVRPKDKATPDQLDQDHGKAQHGKGKVGSLENPEVYENVPGHLIPILEREFDDFDTEAKSFLDGQQSEEQFIGFRLKQGVYGQRQPDVQMIRVKLPMGGINPEQMDAFASVIEKYAPLDKGHITTRQNIQIHHVPLPDAAKLIREISEVGLSSREGCGNTVRNVTGDPFAGVTRGEPFDVTPYAGAYVRYFVRHPTTQLMPRKIKTAFSATDEDVAITGIHDIGFIARERDGVRGVEIRVGGGTSIMPRIAPTLYEFVELDNGEYLKVTEAVLRIFDRQDWLRVNRARARIKVLVDKIGMDAFRELVDAELEGDWVDERDFDVDRLSFDYDEEQEAPTPAAGYASPNGDVSEFERFRRSNVKGQRQEGFSTVVVKVTRGDLTPAQLRGLAMIMRDYTGGFARTTVQQNLVLRWVRDEAVYARLESARRARSGRGRRARGHRHRVLPGHGQLQAGDHQLDGPERRGPGADRADGDHRPPHEADPHQDVGLPQRLQPAPHREHRLLRGLAEGGRQAGPRVHPSYRGQLRGRRGRLWRPPEVPDPREAGPGGGRALASPV